MAPDVGKAKTPAIGLSELNSMAFGLAVYASQCGLPTPHARLAPGRWSGVTGRAFTRKVPTKEFRAAFLHLFPLSQALLGAIRHTSVRQALFLEPLNDLTAETHPTSEAMREAIS